MKKLNDKTIRILSVVAIFFMTFLTAYFLL